MRWWEVIFSCLARIRYSGTPHTEIALALGIVPPQTLCVRKFVKQVARRCELSQTLYRFMGKKEAEKQFDNALIKEHFKNFSLFSYKFPGGWLQFALKYDTEHKLRRLYIHHKFLPQQEGIEVTLIERQTLCTELF